MLNFLKGVLAFKMGQSTSKGMARMIGLGRLGVLFGLVGGWRAWQRHRTNYRTV